MPCIHCRNHYKEYVRRNPIKLRNREELSKWLVRIHNLTNQQLKKPQFAYSKAVQRYSTSSYAKRKSKEFIYQMDSTNAYKHIIWNSYNTKKLFNIFVLYIQLCLKHFLFNNI